MGLGSWWDRHGVPRVIKLACGSPAIRYYRKQLVPLARGRVFEMGCGGGINQPFYDAAAITEYAGIDPNAKLLDYAREAAREQGWQADLRAGIGENIPFEANMFDTVVCTYTLCSVQEPARVLSEMRRILKPGGTLLYLEHGASPEPEVARTQKRIEPVWKPIAGGCHLTREVTDTIARGGFDTTRLGAEYARKTPRFAGWMEWGRAVKDGA